jgi:hypothetical protein
MADAPNVGGVVQRTVVDDELPALVVIHDDDGDWLIGDGVNDPNEDGACMIVHLGHILGKDETLAEVMNLPRGWAAFRSSPTAAWEISRWQYEE